MRSVREANTANTYVYATIIFLLGVSLGAFLVPILGITVNSTTPKAITQPRPTFEMNADSLIIDFHDGKYRTAFPVNIVRGNMTLSHMQLYAEQPKDTIWVLRDKPKEAHGRVAYVDADTVYLARLGSVVMIRHWRRSLEDYAAIKVKAEYDGAGYYFARGSYIIGD